jgi:hypothetical protein
LTKHIEERYRFKRHFIGQLQTNKVKFVVGKCEMIHSLDRLSLAREIDKLSEKCGIVSDCLIEINVGDEENKGGLPLEKSEIERFLSEIADFKSVRVRGLMAVMPNVDEKPLRKYYEDLAKMYQYFVKARGFDSLSAGMSDDFKIAIEFGANIIRLGRILFE